MKPPHLSPSAFSISEFALTVRIISAPSSPSSPRSIVRSSTGVARWASTDHSVTTSKPPAAISGTSPGAPKYACAPLGRSRAFSTASRERSTP